MPRRSSRQRIKTATEFWLRTRCVGFVCLYLCGVCVVFVWYLCGICVVFVWCLCGVCVCVCVCVCCACYDILRFPLTPLPTLDLRSLREHWSRHRNVHHRDRRSSLSISWRRRSPLFCWVHCRSVEEMRIGWEWERNLDLLDYIPLDNLSNYQNQIKKIKQNEDPRVALFIYYII